MSFLHNYTIYNTTNPIKYIAFIFDSYEYNSILKYFLKSKKKYCKSYKLYKEKLERLGSIRIRPNVNLQ